MLVITLSEWSGLARNRHCHHKWTPTDKTSPTIPTFVGSIDMWGVKNTVNTWSASILPSSLHRVHAIESPIVLISLWPQTQARLASIANIYRIWISSDFRWCARRTRMSTRTTLRPLSNPHGYMHCTCTGWIYCKSPSKESPQMVRLAQFSNFSVKHWKSIRYHKAWHR